MSKRQRRTAFYTARDAAGLTQVELARLSGVAQGVISDLETGRNTNPTWDVLSKIAQVLGVRPEQLIKPGKLPRRRSSGPRIIGAPLLAPMVAVSA
jgi:transcriptional regulator with XRE-family HTH domain